MAFGKDPEGNSGCPEDLECQLYVDPKVYTKEIHFPPPSEFRIYDTTLRDGEQTPGVAFTPGQKYEIAKMISRLGCHIIDMGFPVSGDSERRSLQMVIEGKRKGEIRQDLEVLVMCRAAPRDIDSTLEALAGLGADPGEITFLIFTSASDLHIKYKLGRSLLKRAGRSPDELPDTPIEWLRAENEKMVREAVAYVRERGAAEIEFGSEDASRTPIDQLISLVKVAVDSGATRYIFPDTTGSLTPESTVFYCRRLRDAFPGLPMVSHFHNDYDLATVNTMAACRHGMPSFSVTVNGIGERAGNSPLHSVVTALKELYGVTIPGFRYDLLGEARRLVEDYSGIMLQPHEPVVGDHVFVHESGIHAHGVSQHPRTYEPFPADLVGGRRYFLFGKHSGRNIIRQTLFKHQQRLEAQGLVIDDDLVVEVLKEVKSIRMRRSSPADKAGSKGTCRVSPS